MKTIAVASIAGALFIASGCAFAQDNDSIAAREAAIERYMRAVPTSKMLDDAYSEMAKQLPPSQRSLFISEVRRVVNVDRLERMSKVAMAKHFTADEINALADFYSSTHGASAMSKFGVYMADVMPHLMQEIQRAVQELQSGRRK